MTFDGIADTSNGAVALKKSYMGREPVVDGGGDKGSTYGETYPSISAIVRLIIGMIVYDPASR